MEENNNENNEIIYNYNNYNNNDYNNNDSENDENNNEEFKENDLINIKKRGRPKKELNEEEKEESKLFQFYNFI